MSLVAIASDPLVDQRGITRAQWEALVEAGLMDGEHVELLRGVVVQMHPQGGQHAGLVFRLNRLLSRSVPDPWGIRVQSPLAASDTSEPEPDLAVVHDTGMAHPTTAVLVVEVAVTSQRTDLVHKPSLYAAARVDQYWVVDLRVREVVVHTEPGENGYATVRRLPLDTPLSVLGIDVDLAALMADPPAPSDAG